MNNNQLINLIGKNITTVPNAMYYDIGDNKEKHYSVDNIEAVFFDEKCYGTTIETDYKGKINRVTSFLSKIVSEGFCNQLSASYGKPINIIGLGELIEKRKDRDEYFTLEMATYKGKETNIDQQLAAIIWEINNIRIEMLFNYAAGTTLLLFKSI